MKPFKCFVILFLLSFSFVTYSIEAEENDFNENVMYWGVHDETLYLSPTKQGYAVNIDTRDLQIKDLTGLFIDLYCDWYEYAENIKTVEILTDGDIKIKPQAISFWFYDFKNCTKINGLNNLDTSDMVDFSETFDHCESIEELDLRSIDTSKVIGLSHTFDNCYNLKQIDISNFDTSNVIYFEQTFRECWRLSTIDVSHFNTSSAESFFGMFEGCKQLMEVNVSSFDTSNVKTFARMFDGCESLKSLDLSSFNTEKVEEYDYLFRDCSNLETVNISNFDFSSACGRLYGMFQNCSKLKKIDLSNFDTSNIEVYTNMFNNCSSLKELDLSSFDTKNMEYVDNMFSGCTSLKKIIVSDKWDIDIKEIESNDMFLGCTNLVGQSGTKYDENHIDATYAKVDEGETNPGYFTTINDNINKPTDSNNDNEHKPVMIEEKEPISISTICTIAIPTLLVLLIVGLILDKKRNK